MGIFRLLVAVACGLGCAFPRPAAAFTHTVQKGETLAQIAERTYGRIQFEKVLVVANALDAQGGSPIVPGQKLEIPALDHYRVSAGDTWNGLAKQLLGDPERSVLFAQANDTQPWIAPAEGAEIVVPYNLRYIASQGENIVALAIKFLGEKEKAWMLDQYNHINGQPVRRGDVILIPLTSLPLTEAGKTEAAGAETNIRSQAAGSARDAQRKAESEMPVLLADIRGGRYVDAITRGGRLLGLGDLSRPQLALIHRQLTEAYVALEAPGLAAASCTAWRSHDPKARLDPITTSPKILAACARAQP